MFIVFRPAVESISEAWEKDKAGVAPIGKLTGFTGGLIALTIAKFGIAYK